MSEHFDARETRSPTERARDLYERLPALVATAVRAPGWRAHLGNIDPAALNSPEALAALPVLRKGGLPALQKELPPFGGLLPDAAYSFGRLFTSPGPIYEPEGRHDDAWRAARGLFAAGFRLGDVVLNTFSYHLTPGGFILDSGARAVGCTVIPAGPGNTEQQLELIQHLRPVAYTGTPDFLKILLDAGEKAGRPVESIRRAVVSGAAFPPSLQAEIRDRGVDAYQLYATADLGCIAYETAGTGEPVAPGEVGEIVVTSFDHHHPWIRLALGDLSAVLPGPSPCGRTHTRIRGWLGRADQTTKVKGMFVRPEQVAEIGRRHGELGRLRLLVGRSGETDVMTLKAESGSHDPALAQAVEDTLRAVTKLAGGVELCAPGSLPNDGKVIDDVRSY